MRLGIEAQARLPLLLYELTEARKDKFAGLLDLLYANALSVSRNTPAVLLVVCAAAASPI